MSNETGILNLDYLAALHAQKVVMQSDDIDNTVTKTIGVLQEHGVYASSLYLLAKEGTKKGDNGMLLVNEMLALLDCLGYNWEENRKPASVEGILQFVNEQVSSASLERLLFAKETLEQMLVYVRYGAKAKEKKTKHNPAGEESVQENSDDALAIDTVHDPEKSS